MENGEIVAIIDAVCKGNPGEKPHTVRLEVRNTPLAPINPTCPKPEHQGLPLERLVVIHGVEVPGIQYSPSHE